MWQFIGKSSIQIQAIMIVVLVLVTIWYAYSTNKMSSIMNKEFELNNRPFIFVKDVILEPETKIIKISLENVGKMPAKIKASDIKLNIAKIESDHSGGNYSFIYPNEKLAIALSIDDEKIGRILSSGGFSGHINLKYWRINDKKMEHTYFYNIEFEKPIDYKEPNVYNKLLVRKNVEVS